MTSFASVQGRLRIGVPVQVNYHLLGNNVLVLNNDLMGTSALSVHTGRVAFVNAPLPLDQLTVDNVSTLPWMPLTLMESGIDPGGAMGIMMPSPSPGDHYAVLHFDLGMSPTSSTDLIQVALDTELAPLIESIEVAGGNVNITWTSYPDRSYRLQTKNTIDGPSWTDLGDVIATETETSLSVPVGAAAQYYRVVLLPE